MTREDLTLWFQASARLGRAVDEIAFLRAELAKEKARLVKMTALTTEAADNLSKCKITDGSTVRYLEPRILRAATQLCAALTVAGIELPKADLTESDRIVEAVTIPEGA